MGWAPPGYPAIFPSSGKHTIHIAGYIAIRAVGCVAITKHTASGAKIKVHYPFHPFYGQELELVYKPNRGEGTVTVFVEHRSHRKIPLWMVEPKASEYLLTEQAYIHFRALLSVKELITPNP